MNNGLRLILGITGIGLFGGSMYALGRIDGKCKEQKETIWLLNQLNNIIDKHKKQDNNDKIVEESK